MLSMLIQVLIKKELDQADTLKYICCENLQIHLQVVMYRFEHINHDITNIFISKLFHTF